MSLSAIVMLFAAVLILVRSVCLSAHLSRARWEGHKLRFTALAAGNSMLAAGSFGVVLGWNYGTLMLMLGAAFKLLSDQRRNLK